MAKGASIYDVRKIFGILDPLPSLVRIWNWSTLLNSRNLPYYIFFWANPPSPYQCGRHTWMPPKANLWMDHLHLSELRNLVSRHSCTLLGVQSWVRFYQQEFGEFPWPAWTVGSYSSGPPMTWKPMSVDIIHLFWIRGLVTYHLIPVVVAVPQVDESFFTGHDSAHHLTMIFKVILIGHCIRGWQHQSRLFLEAKTCGATPPPIINI